MKKAHLSQDYSLFLTLSLRLLLQIKVERCRKATTLRREVLAALEMFDGRRF